MPIDTRTAVEPHDHVVQFYQHDDELVATVANFVLDALTADGAAIVVATSTHVFDIEAALIRHGIDLVAARRDGSFVSVDADKALTGVLIDGWPNFDAFGRGIGEMIHTLGAGGRRVKVFGEMVALLWSAGQVAAAIELEKVWNDFGREASFSLLCGYAAQSVTGDDSEDAFLQVCHCHSAVLGDGEDRWDPANPFVVHRQEQTRSFIGETAAISGARCFVADTLKSWGLDQLVADGSTVVSELATNAIIHAESDFSVALSSHGDAVRLTVHDHSSVIPQMRNPLPAATSGRGLRLVTALTRRWGSDPVGDGKVVWAEFCG